MKPKKIF